MIVTLSACASGFILNHRFQFKQPTNEKTSTEFEETLKGFSKIVMDWMPPWKMLQSRH